MWRRVGVAHAQITADPGGLGPGGVAQDRRCRRDHHIFQVAQDRYESIRKTQRQRSAAFHIAEEDKRQDRNGREQCRARHARRGGSAVTRRCREGVEHRFGRWVPLRWVLAQQRLYNGGEGGASVRHHAHRRWIVVEDRVQRIDR